MESKVSQEKFSSLVQDIEKGQIKIPQFQRDFVWDIHKSIELIDSILKGYPIGTFIFWKTKERLRSVKKIGGQFFSEPETGDFVDYVLDGQQRITSIYACMKGLKIRHINKKVNDDFAKVYVNLSLDEHEQLTTCDFNSENQQNLISIKELLTGDFEKLGAYPKKYHDSIKKYKDRIENYPFSVVKIQDAPIDIATEIFTRLNVGGKSLTVFEIMVAKTYDESKNFDLSEKCTKILDKLKDVNYETLSETLILQAVSILLSGECTKKAMLNLEKEELINEWENGLDAIYCAIDYLKSYFRIPSSNLLPYPAMVIPFAYFFYQQNSKPNNEQAKYLEDFFWRCVLAGRYKSSLDTNLGSDIHKIDKILDLERPSYEWTVDTSPEYILENGNFSIGRSYVKAILCLMVYHQPKSFNDNSIVNVNNDWLKKGNSKNFHHFFPKAFLKSKGYADDYANSVLNITLVDDFLNKKEIQTKPPSEYMAKFKQENGKIVETMKTHLIYDLDDFGIWSDDYPRFIKKRAEALSIEIKKRIIDTPKTSF